MVEWRENSEGGRRMRRMRAKQGEEEHNLLNMKTHKHMPAEQYAGSQLSPAGGWQALATGCCRIATALLPLRRTSAG